MYVVFSAGVGGDVVGVKTNTGTTFYTDTPLDCGTSVTLTATENDGYKFAKWSDGTTANPYTFTANSDVTISALFTSLYTGGSSVPVIVDGKSYSIGTIETEKDTTNVVVDQSALEKQIEKASSSVVVPVNATTDTVSAELVVKNVEDMATKAITLSVETGGVSYDMRTTAIDTGAILSALGAEDSSKVPVHVTITRLGDGAVTVSDGELVLPAVQFTVTAEYDGKTYELDGFTQYVSRTIDVPAGVDASKITTAIVVENGVERHVPTNVYMSGGKWYAEINSLTNSTYVLIHKEAAFADAAGRWYENTVNEMASRKIINGRSADKFDGDANITRAEFAAIIVRALGLPSDGQSSFTDVAADAWYAGAVGMAVERGIVTGYSDGTFRPNANITRQEAMAMVARAAVITELGGSTSADLSSFADADSVAGWASAYVQYNVANSLIKGSGGYLNPASNITRAETATVILRLLRNSGLVDVRGAA